MKYILTCRQEQEWSNWFHFDDLLKLNHNILYLWWFINAEAHINEEEMISIQCLAAIEEDKNDTQLNSISCKKLAFVVDFRTLFVLSLKLDVYDVQFMEVLS